MERAYVSLAYAAVPVGMKTQLDASWSTESPLASALEVPRLVDEDVLESWE